MRDLGSTHGASSPSGSDGAHGGPEAGRPGAPAGQHRDAEATQVIDQPTQVIDPAGAAADADTEVLGVLDPDRDLAAAPAAEPSGVRRVLDRLGRTGIALVAAGGLLLVLAVVYLIDLAGTSGEIERNTTIAGVDVGGMTPEQALAALDQQVVPGYARTLNVDAHGEPVAVDPAAAGLTPDAAGSVAAAGIRSANPFVRLTSFFTSTDLPLGVQVDRAELETFVSGVAAATDVAPVEGDVRIEGVAVRTVLPVIGRSLQVPESVDAMANAWITGGPTALSALALPTTDAPVRANPEKTEAAAAEATTILAAPLVLQANETPIEIPLDVIASGTTIAPDAADGFTVSVDVGALRTPSMPAAEATQTAPQNATISIVNGAPVIAPERARPHRGLGGHGRRHRACPAQRQPHRARGLRDHRAGADHREGPGARHQGGHRRVHHRRLRVRLRREHPGRRGEGERRDRAAGRHLRAERVHRNPRQEQGYISSGIIQEGRPARAVGGGISQFATTLYNAAYFAGMGDVTHTPHSFYISRYPPGREATVFDGEIELAFSNDYRHGRADRDDLDRGRHHRPAVGDEDTSQVESVTGDRFNYTSRSAWWSRTARPAARPADRRLLGREHPDHPGPAGAEIRREDFTTVYNGQQNVVCEPAPTPATPPGAATPGDAATGAAAPPDPAAPDPAATTPAPGG